VVSVATANEQVGPVQLTKGRDPSNTHSIQRAFVRDILRRFKRIRGLVRATVGYENDALFLKEGATPPSIRTNAEPKEAFDFPRKEGRVAAFMRVLQGWLDEEVLEPASPVEIQSGEHWTAEFLENAYVTGVNVAEGRLMQAGVSIGASDIETALNRPVAASQLRDIYTRAFENLKDITDDMARVIRNELTEAVRDGENPRKVANRLNEEIEGMTRTRATTLARTEIINSHASAAVNTYERAGAGVVSHTSRQTAADASVCPWCRRLDGVPFTLSEFQSVTVRWGNQLMRVGVPAHPNGRCSPMPEVGLSGGDLPPLEERIPDTIRGKSVSIVSR
jgi:SPP1 gp7 family putative phage head morphogenesis protein